MDMVDLRQRIASSFWHTRGQRGSVTRHAQLRGVKRQTIYRESHWVQERLLATAMRNECATLRARVRELEEQLEQVQQAQAQSVCLDTDKQKEFACVGQADGVSLPSVQRLLKVLLKQQTPSVAKLGRWTKQAGEKAGQVLEMLDQITRPRVEQAALDEIYTKKPVLMIVEPESMCWVTGRLSEQVTGQVWHQELQRLPNLQGVTRDAGAGLSHGVNLLNKARQEEHGKPVTNQLDHFHTLREGGCGLGRVTRAAQRAYRKADAAQKELDRRIRTGKSQSGVGVYVRKLWGQAEKAFDVWKARELAWTQAKQALLLVTPEGELNTRAHAENALAGALAQLPDADFGKCKRMLQQPETLAYLDQVQSRLKLLAAPTEVQQAAIRQECLRRRPELLQGTTRQAGAMRGLLLLCTTILAKSGDIGNQTAQAVRTIFRTSWRASSLVECVNSALRMQQARHRKMSQGLLDLKRLHWNCHAFRTGRRRGQSPYQRLGIRLPPELPWWELLKLPPEQLRAKLSAIQTPK